MIFVLHWEVPYQEMTKFKLDFYLQIADVLIMVQVLVALPGARLNRRALDYSWEGWVGGFPEVFSFVNI